MEEDTLKCLFIVVPIAIIMGMAVFMVTTSKIEVDAKIDKRNTVIDGLEAMGYTVTKADIEGLFKPSPAIVCSVDSLPELLAEACDEKVYVDGWSLYVFSEDFRFAWKWNTYKDSA